MIKSLLSKACQLAGDPTLRRWVIGRVLGRWPGEPAFKAHLPPYLEGWPPLAAEQPRPPVIFDELPSAPPKSSISLPLPGLLLTLAPGDEQNLFARSFKDTETLLALHRFAWLPLLGNDVDAAWVQAIWRAWRQVYAAKAYGAGGHDWPWHPYTAAERAINILDFGRRCGLPAPIQDTLEVLAAHAPDIAAKLEYFGDHHTSNHLSNNGRGLYLLGLELGLEQAAAMGAFIMLKEAKRLFNPSGILREGSTHYHLLLARNYTSAWLKALRHGRQEEAPFRKITGHALAVIPHFMLPGGLPLVGDISPDCPPAFLLCLVEGENGFVSLLDQDSRQALLDLRSSFFGVFTESLHREGWLKACFGPWSGLWRAEPEGFSHMPGHGHQDCGGFELHYQDTPVFIDPGRGAYGDAGEAAIYRSASAHNLLLVDGQDPYPPNKPYYSSAFRRLVGGPKPELHRDESSITLRHFGYARLSGVGALERQWHFTDKDLTIKDKLEGEAAPVITRILHTPLACEIQHDRVILQGSKSLFCLQALGGNLSLRHATQWLAYGEGRPITVITITDESGLPWSGAITLEIN